MRNFLCALILFALSGGIAVAAETPAPTGAKVYFVNIKDGDTLANPVTIIFGLSGMGVSPAGGDTPNTGHHHLLIDRPPFGDGANGRDELTANLPADDNHRHFGGGQTEVTLTLSPGRHTLQLVLGDQNHIPHHPPVVSDVITVTIK